jgi:hypothetical protein
MYGVIKWRNMRGKGVPHLSLTLRYPHKKNGPFSQFIPNTQNHWGLWEGNPLSSKLLHYTTVYQE